MGCEETITLDPIKMCEPLFLGPSAKTQEAHSPQKQREVLECHDKAMKLIDSVASRKPAAYREYMERGELRALNELDNWVGQGGKIEEVESLVQPACGWLVFLYATPRERKGFPGNLREEWDFRIDVCTKGTIHRIHPQPEFANKEITDRLCAPDKNKLWPVICERAGVGKK